MKLITGKSCDIQGSDSEAILRIPQGVFGVLLGNIHTDPTKFRQHIPRSHCLVAPICEYHLQPFIERKLPENAVYKLQVPHIVRDVSRVRNHIKVRHVDLHSSTVLPAHKVQKCDFEIDEKYVNIYAKHFSSNIVTTEGINCCSKSANVLIFGSLANNPEEPPSVIVKIYLSSIHSQIKDYEKVSKFLGERLHFVCLIPFT